MNFWGFCGLCKEADSKYTVDIFGKLLISNIFICVLLRRLFIIIIVFVIIIVIIFPQVPCIIMPQCQDLVLYNESNWRWTQSSIVTLFLVIPGIVLTFPIFLCKKHKKMYSYLNVSSVVSFVLVNNLNTETYITCQSYKLQIENTEIYLERSLY